MSEKEEILPVLSEEEKELAVKDENDRRSYNSLDQFQESYEYWLQSPMEVVKEDGSVVFLKRTHTDAMNKARDEWRRFGWRESSPQENEEGEINWDAFGADTRPNPEEEVGFNLLIRKALNELPSYKAKKYLIILVRAHNLDIHFDEETHELANEITQEYPDSEKKVDIAKAYGLKGDKQENSNGRNNLAWIQNTLRKAFLEILGENEEEN